MILSAYLFEHVRLLLLSGTDGRRGLANSSGMVGQSIMAHGTVRATGLFDDRIINSFIGPSSAAVRMDDFNGNNFDHTGLGFIRGGSISTSSPGTPVDAYGSVPPGWPRWGQEYKEYLSRYYTRAFDLNIFPETLPHRENFVDLDPTHRDAWGLPLPRVTFSFHQNEERLRRFMAGVGERIMKETGANHVWSKINPFANRYAGGTRMGADPRTSVLNGNCQAHDVENLFIVGSSVFTTITGTSPTPTICTLAYRTAAYVKEHPELFR